MSFKAALRKVFLMEEGTLWAKSCVRVWGNVRVLIELSVAWLVIKAPLNKK